MQSISIVRSERESQYARKTLTNNNLDYCPISRLPYRTQDVIVGVIGALEDRVKLQVLSENTT